jgi:thiamine phosphate synthase YjbQ (UPF0047 family)
VIRLQTKKFTEKTAGHGDIIDLTPRIHDAIEKAHIDHGSITAFVSGSTAALTTIERIGIDSGSKRLRRAADPLALSPR